MGHRVRPPTEAMLLVLDWLLAHGARYYAKRPPETHPRTMRGLCCRRLAWEVINVREEDPKTGGFKSEGFRLTVEGYNMARARATAKRDSSP